MIYHYLFIASSNAEYHSSRSHASIWQLLRHIMRKHKIFMIGYYLVLLAGLYPLLKWDKIQVFLFINQHYNACLDTLFYYCTNLGNGITYILLLCLLYLRGVSFRKIGIGLVSFGTMSIVVQILKRVFFSSSFRPLKVLMDEGKGMYLHIVDKVEVLTDLSFPSGHSATIFAAVCFLELISKRQHAGYSLGLLLLAIVTAYSRVYLCQHFYTDIYAGAWIGGTITFMVYVVLLKYESTVRGRWLSALYKRIDAYTHLAEKP